MCRRFIYLISFVLVLGLFAGLAKAAPYEQDPGPDGIVSIEAENFDEYKQQDSYAWQFLTEPAGFSGTGLMRAVPDDGGARGDDYVLGSPRLDYKVNFVKTGTHYVWVRSCRFGSNDECGHVGLDGDASTSHHVRTGAPDGKYEWLNDRTGGRGLTMFDVTSTGLHTVNVWMCESGWGIDKLVLTTNPDYTLTGTELGPPESMRGARKDAFYPSPADGATDVPRDVVLSWTPGHYAAPVNGHTVYFSESFDNVNAGIGGVAQSAETYAPPQLLDFNTTYYWRVDEVNGPPDFSVYQGEVWQFTTELFSYPIENITATASSFFSEKTGPENTINGSGLDADDLHSIEETDAWLSSMTGSQPTWIQYEFDRVYKLRQMWVWNYNTSIEFILGFGFKDVTIEYSTNGTDWAVLADVPEFAQASGLEGYAHNTTVDFGAVSAKYVKITANSNFGGLMPQYGLSEVRFFHLPAFARKPDPASGATGMDVENVTLSWRAGREAASHNLYFSADEQAVIDETISAVSIPADSSYANYNTGPLELSQSYYWKVNEVNEAETPTTWQGDVWNFSAQEYLVVDDIEDYNDYEPDRVFDTWVDGWGVPANGSQVGSDAPPFAEQTIVHSGRQSMPLSYDNSTASYSEATANVANLPIGRDWTKYGIQTLVLYFHGDPNNSVEQLYVKVNGSKVVYDGDAANLTQTAWQPWNIGLASFGVNLSNVTELSVGLERSRVTGGKGVVYIDDIRLYSARVEE